MYKITLKNNKSFSCDVGSTIFEAAKASGVLLEHSCLTARCRSCVAKITSGNCENVQQELVLSESERKNKYILTCNSIPKSDVSIDLEDLGNIKIYPKKIYPSKINEIKKITKEVIKITLRLPPNVSFSFNAGQYVNLIKNGISRSYSIANFSEKSIEFFIKNYPGGEMSNYWFNHAKINDLIRLEGPIGTFFIRESNVNNIIFIATGTGVAPIKSILDSLDENKEKLKNKVIWVFNGARYKEDLFWQPGSKNVNYIPVLSREAQDFKGFKGYVQDAVLDQKIDLQDAQVYACGSSEMINSAKELFVKNKLKESQFYSDAFVQTN